MGCPNEAGEASFGPRGCLEAATKVNWGTLPGHGRGYPSPQRGWRVDRRRFLSGAGLFWRREAFPWAGPRGARPRG
ncbi:hypothetical protein AV541_10725 (plasmid) [Thermus parvatiensis]|uniref:Uncharacterized protein n=2 Tax=Thermus TaxID=270 RepID=A0A109QK56_9DEIN|nr:hypothetical protein AV541_10725 [Thermus parvatiensis]RTH27676.1 hypothetical protein CSW40_02440 [Thermus scotoductus]RTI41109.1 hypothetical protein CSW18_03995 [Thermus scotoductus]